jgi:hypothetical protein
MRLIDVWYWRCATEVTRRSIKRDFRFSRRRGTKLTVFWDVTPYSPVEFYRRFRGTSCHQQGALMMGTAGTPNTSVNYHRTPQYPRRQQSSQSPPWVPKLSLSKISVETILFATFKNSKHFGSRKPRDSVPWPFYCDAGPTFLQFQHHSHCDVIKRI